MSSTKKNRSIGGMRLVSYEGKYMGTSAKTAPKTAAHKKAKRKPFNLLVLVPIAAALLLALLIPRFLDRSGQYTLPETGWQYYGGSKAKVPTGSYLKQDSEGNTHIVDSEIAADFSTTLPIYFENLSAVVIPGEMIYCDPRTNTCAKTELFSEVFCEHNNVRILSREKETAVDRGFLFDGKDFYLFLEPVVVKFNGYSLELPALSYVEARYNGDVMVFNSQDKSFLIESPKSVVTAGITTGDYEISLLNDSMVLHDGTRVLLFTRADLLKSIHDQK